MTQKLLVLAFSVFCIYGAYAQKSGSASLTSTNSTSTAMQTQEARDFGLSIVKAYLESNCAFVYGKLASTVTVFESGQSVNKSTFSAQDFCAESPVKNSNTTYQQYLSNYNPEVLDNIEFAKKYPSIQNVLQLKAGDFYFGGNQMKSGAQDLFNAADAVRFVVRKNQNNQFEIIIQ